MSMQNSEIKLFNLYIIYRHLNRGALQFTDSIANLLEKNILSDCRELILNGDFNIQMEKPHLSDTILFNNFLDTLNLTNKVMFSTHLSQHTIDLILVENQSMIVNGIKRGTCFQIIISFMQTYASQHPNQKKN